jgi:hypothetical protein
MQEEVREKELAKLSKEITDAETIGKKFIIVLAKELGLYKVLDWLNDKL